MKWKVAVHFESKYMETHTAKQAKLWGDLSVKKQE